MTDKLICYQCHVSRKAAVTKTGLARLPIGWKRSASKAVTCSECWNKAYILRALIFPIAEPLSGTWKELEADLREMWAQTTAAANWMMTECYARDVRRNGEAKMPPMAKLYLYPEARAQFPSLPPQTIVSLEQATQRKYRARRYEVVWTRRASLPSMRYPQPFPVPKQSWSFTIADGRPVVSVRIGEKRWEMRLKSGARYAMQITGLKKMEDKGELAIYKAVDGTILCKLVGWLTRPRVSDAKEGTLFVRTAVDSLLTALDAKDDRIWVENCDHLKRWIAEHDRRLLRLAEDQKAEQRPVASFDSFRTRAVEKQRNRMKSAIQEIAAHLANFAARRKFASVQYDDAEHGFLGNGFPYFQLADRIRINLDERGIAFEKRASSEATKESAEPLAEEKP